MENDEFLRILRRYRMGEATDAERALVEKWYELLDQGHAPPQASDGEGLEERLWERIADRTGIDPYEEYGDSKPGIVRWMKRWGAAASVAAIILTVGWFSMRSGPESGVDQTASRIGSAPDGSFSHSNLTDVGEAVTLSDGTRVFLSPGATLKASRSFESGRREVHLTGEAFFDVAEDPSRPFSVYSGGIATRVLGTSFNIKPIGDGAKIEVSVRTGKVEVFETGELEGRREETSGVSMNGVVLTPNQRVVYRRSDGSFEASLVEAPVPLSPVGVKGRPVVGFVFSETPLQKVVESLELAYGIEMEVENEGLLRCTFTGDIGRQDLFEKLDILNKALGTTYVVKGTRILIQGAGCE